MRPYLEVMTMRRLALTMALLACGIFASACGAQAPKEAEAPAAAEPSDGEVCAIKDPGPPPVCPEGCKWNGTECRSGRPIVVVDTQPRTITAPTSTAVAAPVAAPSKP